MCQCLDTQVLGQCLWVHSSLLQARRAQEPLSICDCSFPWQSPFSPHSSGGRDHPAALALGHVNQFIPAPLKYVYKSNVQIVHLGTAKEGRAPESRRSSSARAAQEELGNRVSRGQTEGESSHQVP